MSIIAEAPGYLQVFSDGSTKRFAPETAPSSNQPTNGFTSTDVTIDPSKPITARIFLPTSPPTSTKLPVIVYFHGGGFCIGSTTWLGYHHFLGDLSAVAQAIVLSVDYRLAPEHRLPVAYNDCYASLQWLSNESISKNGSCLKQADLSRVFLSGDSAGGNIAHQVCLLAHQDKSCRINIKGLMPIHPYFGGERRTKKEMEVGSDGQVAMNDMFWGLSIPKGYGRDYFGCNYEKQDVPESLWGRFPAVAVHVAGLDFLKERGVMYSEFLRTKGVRDVVLVEAKGLGHVYHVFDPKCHETLLLQKQMTEFMKRNY